MDNINVDITDDTQSVNIVDGTTEGKYVTAGPYLYSLKPDVTTGVANDG